MVVIMGGGTGEEDDIKCSHINFEYLWLISSHTVTAMLLVLTGHINNGRCNGSGQSW